MGRRKIEIQPITHERNRSVTFLKRKNGLFKKAYELGVLCSVDVAVIIFEERPGHHLKLYQYCSSDIHDIVQRHVRHDGEKDTKGPGDFSGGGATKMDDIGDGDDDDVDDDDDIPPRSKRRTDGKLKPPSDMNMSHSDLDYIPSHRTMSIPQPPMPLHSTPSSSIPISSDRLSGLRSSNSGGPGHPHSSSNSHKRPRMSSNASAGMAPHSRSPSDDNIPGGNGGNGGYSYPSQPPAFSRQYHPQQQPSHHSHHHHTGGGGGGGGPQYSSFYPVSQHTPPPPSFIPLQSDFPPPSNSSRGPPPSSRGGGGGGGFGRSSGSFDPGPGMYHPPQHSGILRSGGGGAGSGSNGPGGPGGGGGNGDLFAAFLDADEHHRQANAGFSLDWPVHGPGTSAPPPNSANSANQSTSSSSTGAEGNWLDFLSGNPNAPNTSTARDSSSGPTNPNSTLSWERGGGGPNVTNDRSNVNDLVDIFATGGGRASSGSVSGGGAGQGRASPLVVAIGAGGISKRGRSAGDEGLGQPNGNSGASREEMKMELKD